MVEACRFQPRMRPEEVFTPQAIERFLKDAKDAGVDGLIVVDLPPEEDEELCLPALKAGAIQSLLNKAVRHALPKESIDERRDRREKHRSRSRQHRRKPLVCPVRRSRNLKSRLCSALP